MKLLAFSLSPATMQLHGYHNHFPRTMMMVVSHALSLPPQKGNQWRLTANPCAKMVNGYLGRETTRKTHSANENKRIRRTLGSCLVIPPPKGVKPRAIVKFLGGAFVGAIPDVSYRLLIELLAEEGFLIICVPYNVTFDHAQVVENVYGRYNSCLDMISGLGLPDFDLEPSELSHLPLYSVGHSNGALLQALTGSYFSDKIPKANAIISFNNRPAAEAVPYFEQFGPLVSQIMPVVESSPLFAMAQIASDVGLKGLADIAGEMMSNNDPEAYDALIKFLDQLPGVLNQVRRGTSEFKPKPPENRDVFKQSYNVPRTLLVKFNSDTIDETDQLEACLRPRVELIGGTLTKVTLNGTHLTPCLQEPGWRAGYLYTPADAVVQAVNALLLNDVKVLARTISRWFGQDEE
ncbi:hypothetical protein Dimus_020979 [Dionaea muscipula]